MDNENLIFTSEILEVASFQNYKEATFLISVLDEPDAYGRIIPEDAGEEYCETLIGFPIVAKLKKNIFGTPVDFGGHEVYEVKNKNGKIEKRFGTTPIGTVMSSWVEERELDDFDEPKKCILCTAKLWSSRFPEYFKVFDKLWKNGKIATSWELTATEVEEKDGFKIYKVFEFISNCILGSTKTPAIKQAGVLEYAELDDYDTELAEALEKDIADLDKENEEKEDFDLAEKTKNDVVVDEAEKKENTKPESVEEKEEEKEEETAACGGGSGSDSSKKKKKTATAEIEEPTNDEELETASLTQWDLQRKISKACDSALGYKYCNGYISYWFPEERTVWYCSYDRESELDYKVFTYEVSENDEVTVSEPTDAKLTVSIAEVNTAIAEKENQIGVLKAELEIKDEAIIKAGETINSLKVEISELKPYKEAAEVAEKERIEAEIAEHKEALKNNMLKTNLFSEEEIASAEIAELIEARDDKAIKEMIADRYIASFDKQENEKETEVAEVEQCVTTSVASLESDDVDESPSALMANYLNRK